MGRAVVTRTDRFEIAPHREHHLGNVVPLHQPLRPRRVRPEMFDREQEPPEQFVKLTRIEAQLIASLLNVARAHLPSPKSCDEAIALLMGVGR
jgi:hypothetical protein